MSNYTEDSLTALVWQNLFMVDSIQHSNTSEWLISILNILRTGDEHPDYLLLLKAMAHCLIRDNQRFWSNEGINDMLNRVHLYYELPDGSMSLFIYWLHATQDYMRTRLAKYIQDNRTELQ